jgi:hypothetical protein
VSFKWPEEIGELSAWALDHAIETLEKLHEGDDGDAGKALAVIRLVARMPRAAPWYGQIIDPADSSVDVGVMMRNAFEAVGDHIDGTYADGPHQTSGHWLTQRYLPLWREGKRRYHDFLDRLADPLRWEEDQRRSIMTAAEANAAYRRLDEFRRTMR